MANCSTTSAVLPRPNVVQMSAGSHLFWIKKLFSHKHNTYSSFLKCNYDLWRQFGKFIKQYRKLCVQRSDTFWRGRRPVASATLQLQRRTQQQLCFLCMFEQASDARRVLCLVYIVSILTFTELGHPVLVFVVKLLQHYMFLRLAAHKISSV